MEPDPTNTTPLLYISMAAFASCFIAVYAIAEFVDLARKRRETRARVIGSGGTDGTNRQEEKTGFGYFRELIVGMLKRIGEANQGNEKAPQGSALAQRLMSAGYRREAAPSIFTGVKVLFAVVLPAVVFILPVHALDEAPILQSSLMYLALAAVGLYGPELWLYQTAKTRKTRITNGFPDALDLLVVCIEAGLGLDAAIFRTGVELALPHPDLCEELHLVSLELRAGLPRAQALTNLGWRADIPEVKSLVALLIQTDRFGTSVGQALRVHSDAMRTARTQRAEEMAGKLPVKLLFPLMFFIFPSIFIVILGPAVIQGVRILLPALAGK
ncbi:MAG TPA: type II secretion system F family protein [Candidatus Limnocylindrales bacterium]|nr:type II secretion system F family protein [Candidatus Limnocylindrales bacterium]